MDTQPHRIVGRVDTPAAQAKCIACCQPFKFGTNVFTKDGLAETRISGLCESCFDACTQENDDE